MTNKIAAYNKELQPILKQIAHKQELLKDYKDSNEAIAELLEEIKGIQEQIKTILEDDVDAKALIEDIKQLTADFKEGVKAAAKGSDYKPADLAKYLKVRAKEKTKEVIKAGEVFEALDNLIES